MFEISVHLFLDSINETVFSSAQVIEFPISGQTHYE